LEDVVEADDVGDAAGQGLVHDRDGTNAALRLLERSACLA
jgi:hypothetical protein